MTAPYLRPLAFALTALLLLSGCLTSNKASRELAVTSSKNALSLSNLLTRYKISQTRLNVANAKALDRFSTGLDEVASDVETTRVALVLNNPKAEKRVGTVRKFIDNYGDKRSSASQRSATFIRRLADARQALVIQDKDLNALAKSLAELAEQRSLQEQGKFLVAYLKAVKANIEAIEKDKQKTLSAIAGQ